MIPHEAICGQWEAGHLKDSLRCTRRSLRQDPSPPFFCLVVSLWMGGLLRQGDEAALAFLRDTTVGQMATLAFLKG